MTGHVATSAQERALPKAAIAADSRLRFAAFVLFSDDASVDEEPILGAVLQRLAGAGAEPEVDATTERLMQNRGVVGVFHRTFERVPLMLTAGGVRLTITVHRKGDEPSDWSEFAQCDWPEAQATLAQERTHVAIQEAPLDLAEPIDDCDAAFNRALAVTLATEAVASLRTPLAVLWHPARHALPAEEFGRCLAALSRQRSPLRLWLALRREDTAGGVRIRTEGLRPLAGREVEAEPSPFGSLATEQMVLSMAGYLVDRGGKVGDGTVIDGPRQTRIVVEDARGEEGETLWRLRTERPNDG